jgi:hypothetical protein
MRAMKLPHVLPLVAASVALALAGCSTSTIEIDQKKAEGLARKVADYGTLRLKSVKCPSGEKAKKGATFDCDLTYVDGSAGKITIHQTDDKGSIRTARSDIYIGG